MITTTTESTTSTTKTRPSIKTTTISIFLGCDSIELNLVFTLNQLKLLIIINKSILFSIISVKPTNPPYLSVFRGILGSSKGNERALKFFQGFFKYSVSFLNPTTSQGCSHGVLRMLKRLFLGMSKRCLKGVS